VFFRGRAERFAPAPSRSSVGAAMRRRRASDNLRKNSFYAGLKRLKSSILAVAADANNTTYLPPSLCKARNERLVRGGMNRWSLRFGRDQGTLASRFHVQQRVVAINEALADTKPSEASAELPFQIFASRSEWLDISYDRRRMTIIGPGAGRSWALEAAGQAALRSIPTKAIMCLRSKILNKNTSRFEVVRSCGSK